MKDKKKTILDTALRLFSENGFENTPTSLISKESGVSTGTLFHYFKTKEELIKSLYLEQKELYINAMNEDVETHSLYNDKIKKIWFNAANYILKHPTRFKFIQQFILSTHVNSLPLDQREIRCENLIRAVEEGKNQSIIKDIPSLQIIYICEGILNQTIRFLIEQEIDSKLYYDTINKTFDLLWDMIKQ